MVGIVNSINATSSLDHPDNGRNNPANTTRSQTLKKAISIKRTKAIRFRDTSKARPIGINEAKTQQINHVARLNAIGPGGAKTIAKKCLGL
jgi:hypothetical protein